MYDQRMEEMEKNLETSTRLFPLLKNQFDECQDSLTTVMADWDKRRVTCAIRREGHSDG
jgi:hypothetical protein